MNLTNDKIRKERLEELRDKIAYYSSIIGCSPTVQDYSIEDDGGFVDVSLSDYAYIFSERGEVKVIFETKSLDDFIEFIMCDKAYGMASKYEFQNRIGNQDHRRQLFKKHIELLNILSPVWANRQDKKYKEILKTQPFLDE